MFHAGRQHASHLLRPLGLSPPSLNLPVRLSRRRFAPFRSSSHCNGAESSSEALPTNDRDVVFSGIQPTGVPHLGNYLGAIREWKILQDTSLASTRLIFSIVDLHALTGSQDADQLRKWKRQTMAALIASGLKPDRCVLFFQSELPAHSELMWILSQVASTGYLSRMTQWKSKLSLSDSASPNDEAARAKLKLGLFSYPVLQAADILIHRANLVPVGEDQQQHIEFARDIANSFNYHYKSPVFPHPEAIISPAKRVMSLKDPLQKMSKSHPDPRSRILITDDRPAIADKIRLALTDSIEGISYNPTARPGVSNLIEMMRNLRPTGKESSTPSCSEVAAEYKDSSMKAFKEAVTNLVDETLSEIREKYQELVGTRAGRDFIEVVAGQGAADASMGAAETMDMVRKAVGID